MLSIVSVSVIWHFVRTCWPHFTVWRRCASFGIELLLLLLLLFRSIIVIEDGECKYCSSKPTSSYSGEPFHALRGRLVCTISFSVLAPFVFSSFTFRIDALIYC
uniref:Putative secreted peptide n=1 Tax=Anopheles braziliensis TaxID=58242 RepID=A0A2M3ZP35_9DIPT